MKIKRFYAKTLREALRQVKQELGSDAVILSNNKTDAGIELVAAIDYDEKKINSQLTSNKPTKVTQHKKSQTQGAATKNPDWLQELKASTASITSHNNTADTNLNKQSSHDIDQRLKSDVVSFSQAKKQRNNKKDPYISESRIHTEMDKVLAKDQFSQVFEQQNVTLREDNNKQNKEVNEIFNYDSHLETDSAITSNDTYAKPKIKTRATKSNRTLSSAYRPESSAQPKLEWSQDPMLVAMKEEIQSLKGLLQNQMSGLAWGNFNRNNPHRSELLQRFYKLGLKPSISEAILRQINETSSLEQGWKNALSIISKGIKIAQSDIINEGGMIALVGPTGVGKTTSIAKIASRFTLQYGSSDIALVSTDSYRVGAQEQLKTYAQLLQVPVYFASDEQQLSDILHRLKDKRLVLIDTAGMNQRDIRLTEQLSMLKKVNHKIKLISVLSASAQSSAIHEVTKVLKPYGIDGCIVSKLDESTSLGGIISVIIEQQLPLQYVTDGQKVPEDIHPGRASQLLKRAMGIVRERKDAYDYDDIALSFAGDLLLANG